MEDFLAGLEFVTNLGIGKNAHYSTLSGLCIGGNNQAETLFYYFLINFSNFPVHYYYVKYFNGMSVRQVKA